MSKQPEDDQYSSEETAQRRDEIVRRMLATPPQPKPKPALDSKRGRPRKSNP